MKTIRLPTELEDDENCQGCPLLDITPTILGMPVFEGKEKQGTCFYCRRFSTYMYDTDRPAKCKKVCADE